MAAKNILHVILIVILVTLAWIWGGFVTSTVWGWHAAAPFGLPQITITQAMGIGLVVGCFTWNLRRGSDPVAEKKGAFHRAYAQVTVAFMAPASLLGLAWLLTKFAA